MESYVVWLAGIIIGGGGIGGLLTLYRNRKKVQPETDNIIVTGAETAVLTLQKALESETAGRLRAEAREREKDARIDRLERELESVRRKLMDALNQVSSMTSELASIRHDNQGGHHATPGM